MSAVGRGELADGTRWQIGRLPRRPVDTNGPRPMVVVLNAPGSTSDFGMVAGLRSGAAVLQALATCATWTEVPLAVEATSWQAVKL